MSDPAGGVALCIRQGCVDTTRCTQLENGFPAMSRSSRTLWNRGATPLYAQHDDLTHLSTSNSCPP